MDATYVNHAHNDSLELALETGLPGILLLIAFLVVVLLVEAYAFLPVFSQGMDAL